MKVVRGIGLFASVLRSHRLSTGQDATESFEDVGHSDEARALLPKLFIGHFERSSVSDHTALLYTAPLPYHYLPPLPFRAPSQNQELPLLKASRAQSTSFFQPSTHSSHLIINSLMYLVPLVLFGGYFGWRYFTTGSA